MDTKKKKVKLKLFVWEGVFADYTSGIAFALAKDVDSARKAIVKKYLKDTPKSNKKLIAEFTSQVMKELNSEPEVYTTTTGFYLYGGG